MKKVRIILYVLFLIYVGLTIYMGLNVEKMVSQFGMLRFFSFFRLWFIYGNLFFIVLLVTENIHIWILKQRKNYLEGERKDLIIRVNDLRRQNNDLKNKKP